MRRILCLFSALCLLALLLGGCAGELPPLPSPPGKETALTDEDISVPPEPDAVVLPDAPAEEEASFSGTLELRCSLPVAENETVQPPLCVSGPEEQDCAFRYSDSCELWLNEEGVIRLEPRRYFARFFLSSVRRDSAEAPAQLSDLLDMAKWNATANEMTVGGQYPALRMSSWKYDTYRRWIVWETPERYYTLYVSCFDTYDNTVNAVLDTITESFRAGSDLVSASAGTGETLCRDGGAELRLSGTLVSQNGTNVPKNGSNGTNVPFLSLLLEGTEEASPTLLELSAEGFALPLETVTVSKTENGLFCLEIPLFDENGSQFESLSLRLSPRENSVETLTVTIKGTEKS